MSKTIETLPCPFCGGQAKVSNFPGAHNVWCENQPVKCGNRSMYTLEQWNSRRAPSCSGCNGSGYERVLGRDNSEIVIDCSICSAAPVVERQAIGWFTEDHLTDKSATTYDATVAQRWHAKGWPVSPLYTSPIAKGAWKPLEAAGQIKQGDWLSFTVAGSFFCAQAKLIIDPGTEKEEIVYNRQKNHYFVTSMAVDGTSTHKGVLVARKKNG